MINLIELLFNDSGYTRVEQIDISDARLYRRSGTLQDEFFIIKDFTSESSEKIDELQSEIHSSLGSFFSSVEGAEKNTNLILIKRHQKPTPSQAISLNRKISEIEENPYYFKKSVLAYTEEEIAFLADAHNANANSTLKATLEQIVHSNEHFINFRDNGTTSLFSIAIKIYTKLPFLTYNLKPEDQIDLSADIDFKLQLRDLTKVCKEALSLDVNDLDALEAWIAKQEIEEDV
ncbi:ABC-three component system middle component 1 [Pseudomonas sp. R3-52-08]|uniref:ABC-three component system middle component 1 n=1 Tax=Pseudomonas sp. R3-52-08 TaxID=1173284 RepID=UPI000F5607C6|nr:ABC-three component system middle component 1 [Pseudomonas sp. R3-52-08]AZF23235.1 hypothetical protein C4J91_4516 [Pseudomonas sp. R3-52-08]